MQKNDKKWRKLLIKRKNYHYLKSSLYRNMKKLIILEKKFMILKKEKKIIIMSYMKGM